MVQHVKGPFPEALHNQLRCPRPNAFYHAGGKITQNPLLRPGKDFLKVFHLQLHSSLPFYPFSLHIHLHAVRVGEIISHGGKCNVRSFVIAVSRRHGHCIVLRMIDKHTEAVFLILKNDLCKPTYHGTPPFLQTLSG